jgi:hypothetical protein
MKHHDTLAHLVCLLAPTAALCALVGCESSVGPTLPDAALVVDAAPDADLDPLGYVVESTWLVRDAAPTEASCEADRIARVRLRVLDANAVILDELVAPCSEGAFVGTTILPWGTRHYGEWAALAPDGAELQEVPVSMPIAAAMPRTSLPVSAASFEVRPPAWRDYAAGGVATVSGYPDPAACNASGIVALRLTLTPVDGGEAISAREPCEDGRVFVRTEPLLDYDHDYEVTWESLGADETVLTTTTIDPVRMSAPTRVVFGLDASF